MQLMLRIQTQPQWPPKKVWLKARAHLHRESQGLTTEYYGFTFGISKIPWFLFLGNQLPCENETGCCEMWRWLSSSKGLQLGQKSAGCSCGFIFTKSCRANSHWKPGGTTQMPTSSKTFKMNQNGWWQMGIHPPSYGIYKSLQVSSPSNIGISPIETGN